MPVILRQRLECHYCGRRSKQTPGKKRGGKFQCEHCLAVNFFDENGEIADVPLEEAAPVQRFAQPVQTDPLADDFSQQDSIFCSTCLKNQQLYTYSLSQFLPDPDHLDYDRLEAELPEYKKGLEQRYPQCCAKCEPKVRAQMQKATYNARSDHLRRVLEKSRQRRIASRWGWRSLLVNAAGLGYLASLTLQILWHLYGSQVSQSSFLEEMRPTECLRHRAFLSQCLDAAEPLVGLSLVLGLLCIWWNSKWQHKLSNSEGRLVNLNEYYLAQFVLLSLRFSAWIIMFHVPLSLRAKAMLHACFAVAITVLAGWSIFGIIKVRSPPAVNWHQDPAPLISGTQFRPPTRLEPQEIQQQRDQAFSVSTLANPGRTTYQPWNPPTPPPDSAEAMDWTPSQPTFQPELKQIRYTSADPTPFHGTLPALNARGVLKNQSQKQPGREAMGIPPGFFDKPNTAALPPRQTTFASEAMAQPRFFGHDRESNTGLESIFDSVFSLQDRSSGQQTSVSATITKSVRGFNQRVGYVEAPVADGGASLLNIFSGISIFSVLIGLATWIFESAITSKTSQLGYYLVLLSSIIPLGHIIISLYHNGPKNQFSILLLYALEASGLIGVAMLRAPFGDLFRDLWDKLAIAVVALLLPQELLALNRSHSISRPQHLNMRPDPAPLQPGPKSQAGRQTERPIRERTMAGTSSAIMPSFTRTYSDDSIGTEQSITTTTDAGPWETPRAENFRFDYFDSNKAQSAASGTRSTRSQRPHRSSTNSRSSTRNMFGMDGLSLDGDNGFSQNESTGVSDRFGRGLRLESSSSRSNNARARARQMY